jgi:NADP-dependent 3-hydroxy acid dehydrogenase YdfG
MNNQAFAEIKERLTIIQDFINNAGVELVNKGMELTVLEEANHALISLRGFMHGIEIAIEDMKGGKYD